MRSFLRVQIKRSEWKNGNYNSSAIHGGCPTNLAAKANDGTIMRCCLGFLGNCIGFSDKEMMGVDRPSHMEKWKIGDINYGDAIHFNDKQGYSQEEREKYIKIWGVKYGINFVFVD
jgi:hypothetical protein